MMKHFIPLRHLLSLKQILPTQHHGNGGIDAKTHKWNLSRPIQINCGNRISRKLKSHKHRRERNSYLDKGRLKNHIQTVHEGTKKEFKCECDFCGKSLTEPHALKLHILAIHEGCKDFKCESCDRLFTSREGRAGGTRCTLNAVSVFGGIFDYLIKGLSYQMQTEPKVSKCINKCMCK